VCESDAADPTVQATAAATNTAVKIPRHARRCSLIITSGAHRITFCQPGRCRLASSIADIELVRLLA
jgi:hypothetical protein